MSIKVTVFRQPADNRGDDIVNPLITTVVQAVAVGTVAIDDGCTNRMEVSGAMPGQEHMIPSKVVRVTDSDLGQFNCFLESYESVDSMDSDGQHSTITTVTLEKVL